MHSVNANFSIKWEVQYSELIGFNWPHGASNVVQRESTSKMRSLPDFRGRQASDPPSGRSGHTSTYVPLLESVFLYGGCGTVPFYNDMYEYHLPTQQWYLLQCTGAAPIPTFGHSAALLDDGFTIAIYGGQFDQAGSLTSEWHHFNCLTCDWSLQELECNGTITRRELLRWGQSIVKLSPKYASRLLLFGGMNLLTATNHLIVVDPRTLTIHKVTPQFLQPPPRRRHIVELYREDYMFMFGGRSTHTFFNDLWIYHIEANVWVKVNTHAGSAPMRNFLSHPPEDELFKFVVDLNQSPVMGSMDDVPTPRTGHVSFLLHDILYIMTGFFIRQPQLTTYVFYDVYAYDIMNNRWSRIPSVPPLSSPQRDVSNSGPTGRSMASAVLIPEGAMGPSSAPFLFFHGGRAEEAIADCFYFSVGRPAPSLFQCCSRWLVDAKNDNSDSGCGGLLQKEIDVVGGLVPPEEETSLTG